MVSHLSSPHGLVRFKYSLIIIALLNWFCVSNFLSQRKKKIWRAEELPAWSTTCKDELQQTKTCQSQWDNILKKNLSEITRSCICEQCKKHAACLERFMAVHNYHCLSPHIHSFILDKSISLFTAGLLKSMWNSSTCRVLALCGMGIGIWVPRDKSFMSIQLLMRHEYIWRILFRCDLF